MSGSQMPNTEALSCRVGTISHITARWISDTSSSCHVPAHAEGLVPVGLQSHAADWEMWDVDFQYAAPLNITAVYPARGAVSGGTRVTIEGQSFPTTGRATCRFGTAPVLALEHTATQIVCASPSQRAGMINVEVSVNRQDFTLSSMQFQYVAPPSTYTVSPKTGPSIGGSVIAVQGDHFSLDAGYEVGTRCLFANRTIGEDNSNVVSSRLMRCETPAAREPGNAMLELSVNGLDHTSDLATFRYVPQPEVEGAYPLVGSEQGGGVVVVYGSFLFDSDDVSCRIGTITGIQASLVTTEEISCAMPGHVPGPTQIDVTLNAHDYTTGELLYDYEPLVDLFGPVPTRVLAEGGAEILLSFWPSDTDVALSCVVDSMPVPAQRVGQGMFTCITPPRAPGFAALDGPLADACLKILSGVLVLLHSMMVIMYVLTERYDTRDGSSLW